jgi:hypothetical protein
MKIQNIKIQKFKGIDAANVKVGGKNVYLVGGNGKGKTSFIDAFFKGVSGKGFPPQPIKDDGKKGLIEIDLGDFIARTKFKKGRPTEFELENKVYNKETEKFIKSPRTYMEKRIGILDFDVNNFLGLSDAKQVEYVAKYMGEDFSEIDIQIEENMETRKFDKSRLKALSDTVDYYTEEDAAKDPIDIVAISKEIENEIVKSSTKARVDEGILIRSKRCLKIDDEIEALEVEKNKIISELKDAETWLKDPDNILMSDDDLAVKIKSRDNATEANHVIQEAKVAKATTLEIEKIEAFIEESNANILEQKELKAKKIADFISMDGLTYSVDNECFLFEGRPFDKDQTNTAAQLITGMKIASMLLKELKILRVDASLIDNVEFEKVLIWAKKNDIELFVEFVDREAGKLRIEVQDDDGIDWDDQTAGNE